MQKVSSVWQGGQKNSVFFNQDVNLHIDEKGQNPTKKREFAGTLSMPEHR
ncbi:hypothetical protein [Desulfosporosinus shakirovi]|nr:hypothetical protein [Desulfosporosinus sp. SRJS8]MCB8815306.1 hypothetical protein [Desulfosporosinus sp. SRJS8]